MTSRAAPSARSPSRSPDLPSPRFWRPPPMNGIRWIVQAILAVAFVLAGVMKSTQPKEKLQPNLPWVEDFSLGTVRLIGVAELLGGLGLILPAALDIAPILTPIAASCLALVM